MLSITYHNFLNLSLLRPLGAFRVNFVMTTAGFPETKPHFWVLVGCFPNFWNITVESLLMDFDILMFNASLTSHI